MTGILIIAAMAAFGILLAKKWRITEWLQMHAPEPIARLAGCDFCMSWWAGLTLSAIFAAVTGDAIWIVAPLITTPITRIML